MADNTGTLPSLQTVAKALGGEVNGDQVLCPGPGHSAADRSLSIKVDVNAPDGFIVNSFAGDDAIVCKDFVRDRLGLPAFKPNGGGRRRASREDIERLLQQAVMQPATPTKINIVATYDYTDADGKLLFQVAAIRTEGLPAAQTGRQWRLDLEAGRAARALSLAGITEISRRHCFHNAKARKDADRVASLGLCATTTGKWTDECVKALAGRDVVILEDNDDAGKKKALAAAHALHGTAKTIRIVSLPDLPDKGDVSDWLDADPHHANKFRDVCFDAPLWNPADDKTPPSDKPETASPAASTENKPAKEVPLPFVSIIAWQDQPVPERQWTVRDRIPGNNVTIT